MERWSELSFNFRTVLVDAYPQQVTHIYVPLLKPSIALRGKQPFLQMRYEVLGDIGFQFDVSGQFDRDEVAGVDIVELPFRKPDVIFVGNAPIRKLFANDDDAVDSMSFFGAPSFPGGIERTAFDGG
jgi:hypothetical protein